MEYPHFNRRPQVQPKPKEKEKTCRIRTKRDKDGRVIDTQITDCSPAEVRAIMGEDKDED